jgi:hypothetical protein
VSVCVLRRSEWPGTNGHLQGCLEVERALALAEADAQVGGAAAAVVHHAQHEVARRVVHALAENLLLRRVVHLLDGVVGDWARREKHQVHDAPLALFRVVYLRARTDGAQSEPFAAARSCMARGDELTRTKHFSPFCNTFSSPVMIGLSSPQSSALPVAKASQPTMPTHTRARFTCGPWRKSVSARGTRSIRGHGTASARWKPPRLLLTSHDDGSPTVQTAN